MIFFDDYQRVLREEAAGDGGEGGGGGTTEQAKATTADADAAAALTARLADLERQVTEQQQAAQYWHDQYKSKEAPAKETKAAPVDEAAPIDPIELLSKEGEKGLDKLLERRGYVKRSDVENTVASARTAVTEEQQLLKEYPELGDNKSDFFKQTSEYYRAMTADGVPGVKAMRLAAQQAELAQLKSGKRMTQADIEEREARASAAGGDKTKKGGKATSDAQDDDRLDAMQEQICREMCPDGVDLKKFTENYIARAKKGVIYTGAKI